MTRDGLTQPDRPLAGPQHYWNVMRELTRSAGGFTISDVHGRCNGVLRSTVQNYVLACLNSDFLDRLPDDGGSHSPRRYVVKVTSMEAPTEGRGFAENSASRTRQHLWTAMRVLPFITPRDLAIAASTDEVQIAWPTAATYMRQLARAGYLQIVHPARGPRPVTMRLKPGMSTGPKAPVVHRNGTVVDRNRREVVGSALPEARP